MPDAPPSYPGYPDPQTLQQLQGLLGLMQAQPDDLKKINSDKWLNFGLGLMQAKKGNELGAFGSAGMNAIQQANAERTQLQAQRGQNMTQAIGLLGIAKQTQNLQLQQDAMKQITAAMNGGGSTTTPGTTPADAVGGGGMGGGTGALFGPGAGGEGTTMLSGPGAPGPVGGPPVTTPSAGPDRAALAKASLAMHLAGGPDMSGALKFMYPDPVAYRAGADVGDPATGKVLPGAPPIAGYYWDRVARKYVKAEGGAEAEAAAATIPKVVSSLFTPQPGILPGGAPGVVGNQLSTLFPDGRLPYGAPSPFSQAAPAPPQSPQAAPGAAQAAPAPAPTAQQRAPVQTALSPEQSKVSEGLGADANSYRDAIAQSSKAQGELGLMKQSLANFTPGPWTPALASAAGVSQQLGPPGKWLADKLIPNSATALPAIAALEKQSVGLTAEQSKVFGSREGQQVIGMIKSANANAGMVPGAPDIILDAQIALHQYVIDKGQAALTWRKNPDNNGSLDGFAESWDKVHPVSSYIPNMPALKNISEGKPPSAARAPDSSGQTTPAASAQSYGIAPAAKGNATVQLVLKNGTPQQKAALAAKGYLVAQ